MRAGINRSMENPKMSEQTDRSGHAKLPPVSSVASFPDYNLSTPELAVRYLCAWKDKRHYPGLHRIILATLPRKYTWQAVQHWRAGRRRLPVAVAEAWIALLQSRIAAAQSLVAALQAHIDETPPPQPKGFMRVDESGRDKRGHWRR
jgi:hypothetical protein